jgi:hypothetical protein
MKQRNQCKGRKESLGKETDVLYPDEQFDAIALMLGHRLRVVCGGRGEGVSRCIEDHAVSSGNLFVICYIG